MISSLIQALTVFLPTGYLVAAVLFAMAFAGEKGPQLEHLRKPLLRILFVLHVALFALHGLEAGSAAARNPWLAVAAVALALVGLFVVITRRYEQPTVGALVLTVAGLLQSLASMFGPVAPLSLERTSNAATAVHAVTAAVASGALILSGLYGFLYLVLLHQMRHQKFGAVVKELPDLRQLARMTRRAALAGFIGLALGVNIGIGLAHARGTAGFGYTDPTVILYLGLWLHFGLIAFSAKIRGISAQRASVAALAGLTVVLAALLLAVVPGATFHALR